MDQFFKAIPEQANAKDLQKALEGTVAKDSDVVAAGSTICLWYDSKCAGEASSQPHCRVPKFRQSHFRTFLQGCLGVRKLKEMDPRMLVCLSDGFRPGLENSATTAFVLEDGTSVSKHRTLFHNIYDAASLSARKTVVRGVIQNVEGLHVFSEGPSPTLAEGSRSQYTGNCSSSGIGPIKVPSYEDSEECWRPDPKLKAKYIGSGGKVLVSGPGPAEPGPAFADKCMPLNFYTMPRVYYREILHSFRVGMLICGTEMDGNFPLECILHQVPVVAVCLTTDLAEDLRLHLINMIMKEMGKPKSSAYQSGLWLGKQLRRQCGLGHVLGFLTRPYNPAG